MSAQKHTPGEWIRDDDEIGVEVEISGETSFLPICTLQEPSLYHTSEAILAKEGNALLILAAAEMADLLKKLYDDYWLANPIIRNEAEAVLKKAGSL